MDFNPYENKENLTPDYTPDEYYKNNFSDQENSAEIYAKYGENFYTNTEDTLKQEAEAVAKVDNIIDDATQEVKNTSYSYGPTDVFNQNSSGNTSGQTTYKRNFDPYTGAPINNNYSASTNNNAYNPYNFQPKSKPKKKKDHKPITRGALVAVLVICIIFSSVFGLVGGYFVGNKTEIIETDSGLIINQSNGNGPSYKSDNASLSTTEIVEKAASSVVEITTEAVVTSAFSQQFIQEGAGSGVIISTDGYIITNYHVIEGATHISVTLRDGTVYDDAEVIGTYEAGDIALLKIKSNGELSAAVFGNSDNIEVGDYAVAIGNPLGQLGGTVTDGIISALDREVTIEDETMNLLQTNAEISPGNSGGGLFNGNGELIGIVNAKSSTEEAEGLGFAIPINDVQDVLGDLKDYGYVKGQIDLGMSLSNINSTASAWMFGATYTTGVYVTSVNHNSNAAKAGFIAGDIIYAINDEEVTSTTEVKALISKFKVGDKVEFGVYRGNQKGTITMELQEYTQSTNILGNYENSQQGYNIYEY